MKSCFITIPFDRMKNTDLKMLYLQLTDENYFVKTNIPEIDSVFERLKTMHLLSRVLETKVRKKIHTNEITKLRAANDKLIAGLLFQIKALQYAQFEEHKTALFAGVWLAKYLKGYSRSQIFDKTTLVFSLNNQITHDVALNDAIIKLGIMRYVDKLNETNAKINALIDQQKLQQADKPAPNTTIPTKEKLIAEIRFYLRSVDAYMYVHPEVDISLYIHRINLFLKAARAQLRNTTTRRIRKKERENTPTT